MSRRTRVLYIQRTVLVLNLVRTCDTRVPSTAVPRGTAVDLLNLVLLF
jgi:hypothetical protein